MDNKDEQPYVPHFISARDIALIENRTMPAAQSRLKRLQKKYSKDKKNCKWLTTEDYCREIESRKNDIARFFTKPLVIILLLTSCVAIAFAEVVRRNYFPELNDWLKKHHVIWDSTSPTHQHGTMWIKNDAGQVEKTTIDVQRMDTIPEFFKKFQEAHK